MNELSHVDSDNRPAMVDVSGKRATDREAHARAIVRFPPEVASRFANGDIQTAKGPVFATAIIAGVSPTRYSRVLISVGTPMRMARHYVPPPEPLSMAVRSDSPR